MTILAAGIALIGLGGLVSASYYTPVYRIKNWAWITSWIVLLFFAWIVFPILAAELVSGWRLGAIMKSVAPFYIIMTLLFGILRGFGGLMNGLSFRYLGISLGNSICIGVCAVFGTLVPPLIDGTFVRDFSKPSGWIAICGLLLCVLGTAYCGMAGMIKEERLEEEKKRKELKRKDQDWETVETSPGFQGDPNVEKIAIREFAFGKGVLIAVGGGIMSACMAIAIKYGNPIDDASVTLGTSEVFKSVPALVLSMGGGYITNLVYGFVVAAREQCFGDLLLKDKRRLLMNTFWAALSGLMVYGQYFLYVMGATKLGKLEFTSWTIFMSAIILGAALWGLLLREWKDAGGRARTCLWIGIVVLVLSVCVIGIGPSVYDHYCPAENTATVQSDAVVQAYGDAPSETPSVPADNVVPGNTSTGNTASAADAK